MQRLLLYHPDTKIAGGIDLYHGQIHQPPNSNKFALERKALINTTGTVRVSVSRLSQIVLSKSPFFWMPLKVRERMDNIIE
jgi:hypothetical protein